MIDVVSALRQQSVQITIIAVVIGTQVSHFLFTLGTIFSRTVQLFSRPALAPGVDVLRALQSTLIFEATQALTSAAIAIIAIWLLAHVVSRMKPGSATP